MKQTEKAAGIARPSKPDHLIPPELEHLVSDRPLTYGEIPADYDKALVSIFADLDPQGTMEAILAKDVADWVWEMRRLKRLRAAAIAGEWAEAAWRLLGPVYSSEGYATPPHKLKEELARVVRGALLRIKKDAAEAHSLCLRANVRPDLLEYEAHKAALPVITAIQADLEKLERRREKLLRFYTERRAAKAAMARDLLEREAAATEGVVIEGEDHAA